MDPLLDLVRLLRPRATLWGGLEASGRWGLGFRARGDLLFCWIERGECLLVRPPAAPLSLRRGDFVLIRADAPFSLASDPAAVSTDSERAVTAGRRTRLRLGSGPDDPVSLRGGRFVFDAANEDMLVGLLPSMVRIAADDAPSARVRALLRMNEAEARRPRHGSGFVVERLVELILVETLRNVPALEEAPFGGLLAGLADPALALALAAMHGAPGRPWTVAALARRAGVSRSTLASRFRAVVGTGPIEYLQNWRMALAKEALREGVMSVGEIATEVGFHSPGAFSTAFSRAVGVSPRRFAKGARGAPRTVDDHA